MKIFVIDKIDPPKTDVNFLNPLLEIMRELSDMGHEIHVVSSERAKWHNVYFHGMIFSKKWPILFQIISYLFSVFGILALAIEYKFDIVYFRMGIGRVIALLLKKFFNLKYICEVHGIEYCENEYSENKNNTFIKLLLKYKADLQIISAKKADGVRVVTKELKNFLVSYGVNESKVDIIENGVNTTIFKPLDDINIIKTLKKKYGIEQNSKVVMWEGYFYPWQGVEYLIKASQPILRKEPNTTFVIVGDGEMMNSWKKLARDLEVNNKFIFTGAVPYEEVSKYINISDVCVSPEIADTRNQITGGSSLKLFEYLACGKPAIVGNLKGNMKIIANARAGIIVDPRNLEELSDAIIRLLINEKEATEMGRRGREYILKEYNWNVLSKQVLTLCEKVAKNANE
jgi:glycosyltransferase involved in cell wall biosynthesis